jgi:p-aminobenzoyl-glutamate transporter AbgT
MLLADGNGSFVNEPVVSPTSVGQILDGISTTSAIIVTPSPTTTPGKVITGVINWYWILLTVVVVIAGAVFLYKKVFKHETMGTKGK